jgi:hypothetical protein
MLAIVENDYMPVIDAKASHAARPAAHGGDGPTPERRGSHRYRALGHESVETTQLYLHSDLRMKQAALARTQPTGVKARRYRPKEDLLAFLERSL